jgi:AraC-like DNA-binding protein
MMDPLADVLRSVRLTGGVFLDVHFTAPWCVTTRISEKDCEPLLPKPAQIIAYHVIIEGSVLLSTESSGTTKVGAGEIVLLPRNDSHQLASENGLSAVAVEGLIQPSTDGGLARIDYGGGGQPTHIVCGFLGSEDRHNPVIASLPPVLTLDIREAASRDWIESSVRFAAAELTHGRLASSGTVSRLSELLFVEAVRGYVATLTDPEAGWLKGLRDPHVGRALALIHQNIRAPWTADDLAREVALSRSAFVDRFRSLVGTPPIRYLTTLRMQTAKLQLRETPKSVSEIANMVGYESDEAFRRAFKREFNETPAHWRDVNSAA